MKTPPTPIESFLAPLVTLAQKQPSVEGLVFWHDDGWSNEPSEELDAEEVAFYAEGLLLEGFRMVWQVVADAATPTRADHVRLFFWQEGAPEVPDAGDGWHLMAAARWTGA